jgi:hypothetical protein
VRMQLPLFVGIALITYLEMIADTTNEGCGLVALTTGDAHRAADDLQQAAAQWQALGRPYDQARVLVALVGALAQASAAGEARLAVDQALSPVEQPAAQLQDAEMQAAFLRSPLVQELDRVRETLSITP